MIITRRIKELDKSLQEDFKILRAYMNCEVKALVLKVQHNFFEIYVY